MQKQVINFATPEEIRVGLGINTSGVSWELKINDIEIPKNGDFEYRSKSLQLYHKNHPIKEKLSPKQKGYLCLNEGKNKIHISFKLEDTDKFKQDPSAWIYMNSLPYDKYVLENKSSELKFGVIEADFYVFRKMPENYTTKILNNK